MKKLAVAVALAMGVVGTANAGFYCKLEGYSGAWPTDKGNNFATSKALEWHYGNVFPDTTPFDYRNKDVACFVDGGLLADALPNIGGLKKIPALSIGAAPGTPGLVYRGDDARWLIDNLRSFPSPVGGQVNNDPGINRNYFFGNIQP